MNLSIVRYFQGKEKHIVRENSDNVLTYCNKIYSLRQSVFLPADVLPTCEACIRIRARSVGKKPYFTPHLSTVRDERKRAWMRNLLGVRKLSNDRSAELERWRLWTGEPHPSVVGRSK